MISMPIQYINIMQNLHNNYYVFRKQLAVYKWISLIVNTVIHIYGLRLGMIREAAKK